MSDSEPVDIFFNGIIAAIILKHQRKLNEYCAQCLPDLSSADLLLLLYIHELVWRQQTREFIARHEAKGHHEEVIITKRSFNESFAINQSIRRIALNTQLSKTAVARSLGHLQDIGLIHHSKSRITIIRTRDGVSEFIERCPDVRLLFNDCEDAITRFHSNQKVKLRFRRR